MTAHGRRLLSKEQLSIGTHCHAHARVKPLPLSAQAKGIWGCASVYMECPEEASMETEHLSGCLGPGMEREVTTDGH